MRTVPSLLICALVLVTLTGCGGGLRVTYYSDPPGGVLYVDGQRYGFTPVTLNYEIRDSDRRLRHVVVPGPEVRWVSGASASVTWIDVELNKGKSQDFTFTRPRDVPGREVDVRFALEVWKLALMRRQREAQEDQEFWETYNQINRQQPSQPTTRNCTSLVSGNVVHTTCQ